MDRTRVDALLQKMLPNETKEASFTSSDALSSIRKDIGKKPSKPQDDEDEEYVSVGLDGILSASEKLLAVNRGLEEPDDRDSLSFKKVMTTDKLLSERIELDNDRVRRSALSKLARQKSLKSLHPFSFDNYMEGFLLGNPLSMPLEEINPLHLVEQSRRVTQIGPGGIGSDNAITEDMQNITASQFGFLSTLEGPESSRAGVDTRFAVGTKIGSDGKIYQLFKERKTGKLKWLSPSDMNGKVLGLPE